jgi:pimeloyl-ACP methyl ester carboxylesterase
MGDAARAVDMLPGLIAQRFPDRSDPTAVVTIGHSAGGHLGLWAALTAPNVTGAVSLAGVVDLGAAYLMGSGSGAVARFMGGGPDEVPERYAAADPARLAAPTVPVVLVHGELDEVLPVSISLEYGERFGVPVIMPKGSGHFNLIEPDSTAWPSVLQAIDDVLGR